MTHRLLITNKRDGLPDGAGTLLPTAALLLRYYTKMFTDMKPTTKRRCKLTVVTRVNTH